MHQFDEGSEVLIREIVAYASERIRMTPPPLDGTASAEELEEAAGPVLFLASPHASAITGQSIAIDGGSTPGIYY